MKLSIAICTWNRAQRLRTTLNQLASVVPPSCPWELIVVNNNSTDETESVLDYFAGRLPLRRVWEATPGLSNARNAAVKAATGDYVIWTDDDVLVGREWLVAYERAFRRWPDAAVFGGPVRPWFEGTPPAWLTIVWPDVSSAFAVRDLGRDPLRLNGGSAIPYGANYALRITEQRKYLYDPELGRRVEGGLLGEEVAVIRAVIDSGKAGWWVPDASVEHLVPRERQTLEYIGNYYEMSGRTALKLGPAKTATLFGRPRWALRKALEAQIVYRFKRLGGDPRAWIRPFCEAAYYRGMLRGSGAAG
jgi:glycosyltransferase involved in cell wall biosynthesis